MKVTLATDAVGESATATVAAPVRARTLLLENVRYDARETSKVDEEREELAREYASSVTPSFPTALVLSTAAGSVYDIAKLLPRLLACCSRETVLSADWRP